jgi:hypothetical protein
MKPLEDFIIESNRIEGILGRPLPSEFEAYSDFLYLTEITIFDIESFVRKIATAHIRSKKGMNVVVGSHRPIDGGPKVVDELHRIVNNINNTEFRPYSVHIEYEKLHPFMDGNGRSGRIIWAWMMQRDGQNPFHLGFLHSFYYQTLENSRI